MLCAICERENAIVRQDGVCPDCESLYRLVDTWFTEYGEGTPATVVYEEVAILKARLGRFFREHQAPKPMQWG